MQLAYSDFTLPKALRTFDLSIANANLFAHVAPLELSAWLRESLERAHAIALFSEKSRCEFIVAPILLACQELAQGGCSLYSGVRLDVDPERGLKGECDFLLGSAPPSPALRAPFLIVVEAKKNDIEEGLGQCAAQMFGVRLFNEQEGTALRRVHGCVTTGEVWQFLRLEGRGLIVDAERYYLREVDKLLGIVMSLFREESTNQLKGERSAA